MTNCVNCLNNQFKAAHTCVSGVHNNCLFIDRSGSKTDIGHVAGPYATLTDGEIT